MKTVLSKVTKTSEMQRATLKLSARKLYQRAQELEVLGLVKYMAVCDPKFRRRDVSVEMMETCATKKIFGAGIPCSVVEIPRPQCGMSYDMLETTEIKPWHGAFR